MTTLRARGPIIAGAAGAAALIVVILLSTRRAKAEVLAAWRAAILSCASDHADARTLYEWGGGHAEGGYGLDCSGLVIRCGLAAGMRFYMTADDMYKKLAPVVDPKPGDLAVYGTLARAIHVKIVTAWHPEENRAETISAENGGPDVTTPEAAIARGAWVRRLPTHRAHNFLGFRSLASLAPS